MSIVVRIFTMLVRMFISVCLIAITFFLLRFLVLAGVCYCRSRPDPKSISDSESEQETVVSESDNPILTV